MDYYKIAVGILIETIETLLLEGYENEDFIFLENEDFDTDNMIERIKKRIEVIRKLEN